MNIIEVVKKRVEIQDLESAYSGFEIAFIVYQRIVLPIFGLFVLIANAVYVIGRFAIISFLAFCLLAGIRDLTGVQYNLSFLLVFALVTIFSYLLVVLRILSPGYRVKLIDSMTKKLSNAFKRMENFGPNAIIGTYYAILFDRRYIALALGFVFLVAISIVLKEVNDLNLVTIFHTTRVSYFEAFLALSFGFVDGLLFNALELSGYQSPLEISFESRWLNLAVWFATSVCFALILRVYAVASSVSAEDFSTEIQSKLFQALASKYRLKPEEAKYFVLRWL